jgi:biopolymer transport protein ExbB/TolQ|tara:strand:- start:387 stop:689 length:303 start_codon:yes stop_codon:yes gene_type:complete
MKSLWKYITGLFTFIVGILVLSGKKNKKVKELKGKIKDAKQKVKKVDSKIKSAKKESDAIKKSLKSKKKALKEIKKSKLKKKDISVKDASNFLKKYKEKK